MTYPDQIKSLRKSQGLSQKQLGEKVGLSRLAIGLIERGQVEPSTDNLTRIAEVLGCRLIVRLEKNDAFTAEDILKKLVDLKDHKDQYGKDERYMSEQPAIWQMAREFLAQVQ